IGFFEHANPEVQSNSIVDNSMNTTALASMKLCQRNNGIRRHAMCPIEHPIKYVFDLRVPQISCHHCPCLWKNIGVMNGNITLSQIQAEIRGKLLYHLHRPFYDLHKGDFYSRGGVVVDS